MNEDIFKFFLQHGPWAVLCVALLCALWRLQAQQRSDARDTAEQLVQVIKSSNAALSQLSATGDALADRITAQQGLLDRVERILDRLERILDRRK